MEHPFINNISNKSLEDLQQTISSLTEKLNYAYRTGNRPLINQITMAIESYKNAYSKKMDEILKSQITATKK